MSENKEEILGKIREFADKAHGEQKRKYAPERYIVHPERVAGILRGYTQDIPLLAAAYLHDVLEDTETTAEDIRVFLEPLIGEAETARTIGIVVELTDVYVKKAYPELNRKKRKELELERIAKTGSDSQTIKYADILDNTQEIVAHDRHFAGVFLKECRRMLKAADKGDPRLYKKAVDLVEEKISLLSEKGRGS